MGDDNDTDVDTNTDDNEDTDVDGDDEDDEEDVIESEEEDLCEGLIERDCDALANEDGDVECAYNKVSGDCYGIKRREGRFGSGNFDDGFIAAQQEAEKDQSGLYAVIGVLGGVVGIMFIVIAFGGYWVYNNSSKNGHGQVAGAEMTDVSMGRTINIDDDDQALMADNVTRS